MITRTGSGSTAGLLATSTTTSIVDEAVSNPFDINPFHKSSAQSSAKSVARNALSKADEQSKDFNKNGQVDNWEVELANKVTTGTGNKLSPFFQLSFIADENGDGKATKTEIKSVFNTIDINGDDKLDSTELNTVYQAATQDGKRGLSDVEKASLKTLLEISQASKRGLKDGSVTDL